MLSGKLTPIAVIKMTNVSAYLMDGGYAGFAQHFGIISIKITWFSGSQRGSQRRRNRDLSPPQGYPAGDCLELGRYGVVSFYREPRRKEVETWPASIRPCTTSPCRPHLP